MSEKVKRKNDFQYPRHGVIRFWVINMLFEGVLSGLSGVTAITLIYVVLFQTHVYSHTPFPRFVIGAILFCAAWGLCVGSLYGAFLNVMRRSLLSNRIRYRNFMRDVAMVFGLWPLIWTGGATVYFLLVYLVIPSNAVNSDGDFMNLFILLALAFCLFCFFELIFLAWRFSRLHRRFVSFYFGEERKRKVV